MGARTSGYRRCCRSVADGSIEIAMISLLSLLLYIIMLLSITYLHFTLGHYI